MIMSMTCGDTDDKELTQIHGQVMRDKEHSVMKRVYTANTAGKHQQSLDKLPQEA